MDALEYIESQAAKNASFHIEGLEILNKRAHTLVTLQLGGGGALGAVAMSMVEKSAPIWVYGALFTATAWLFWIAYQTTRKCLMTSAIRPPANTPLNLLPGVTDLPSLRLEELKQLDARLKEYAQRADAIGIALNRAYRRTAITPVLASAAAALVVLLVWAR